MASLTLPVQPGFTVIEDTALANGTAATEEVFQPLNADVQFAAVRNEQFWGFYRHGETVQLPTSPADGYEYQRDELRYSWSWFSTGAPQAALNGTHVVPANGSTSGQGTLLQMWACVGQDSGLVECGVAYYKTAQQNTNDGILLVIVHAQRLR